MAELSLSNQFLLAMPSLTGTYFGGSIIYLMEHNAEGAMGLIINRPSELSLYKIARDMQLPAEQPAVDVAILEGGPVQTTQGFVLHTPDITYASSTPVSSDVLFCMDREAIADLAIGTGPEGALIAFGYAGWGAGQLEQELTENAWLHCPASADILFNTPFAERVQKAAAALGIDFTRMSGRAGYA